jgi:hypothetical protein
MNECCRREQNWKGKGGKSVFDYDAAPYVRKTTRTYMECRECGSPLTMETVRTITDRLVKRARKKHAPGSKTVPG